MRLRQSSSSTATPRESLLDFYLKLSNDQRQAHFAVTYDVAEKYGVAQRTVQDWISNGLIDAVLIGKKYKVDLQSVERHLRQCD